MRDSAGVFFSGAGQSRILALALVAEKMLRGGTVVLNADAPRTDGLARRAAVRDRHPVVRFFSLSASSPVVMAHRMSGGIACLLRDNQLIEARDGKETVLPHADELPGSFGGAAIHLLANALAVCRAVGVRSRTSGSFAPFTPAESNPGRDRRDDLVAESAATVATWFSRVVVYEDRDLRGREAARWPG